MAEIDQMPDILYSSKTEKDDSKKSLAKDKENVLRRLKDELDKTTRDSLLHSPAIISPYGLMITTDPLFSTEQEGGQMLITENPNYFRKDLPNHVPQLFIFSWNWNKDPYGMRFKNAIEENFPIEKLKALIDK